MKYFFFFSFLFFFQSFYGQIDRKDLKKMTYDELKKVFFENEGNIPLQKQYANEYVSRAKKENDQSKLARGYYYHSLISQGQNKIIYFDSIINNTNTPKTDKSFPIVAHFEKAMLLESLFRFDEAVNSYLNAEKLSLKRNMDYYYHCKFAIGILKSEKMGEVEEALPLFKEFNNFFDTKKNDSNYSHIYENSLFALADAYKSLRKMDSSSYYNNLGYNHSKKFKNEYLNAIFILNEGANQTLMGNYKASLDSIDKCLPIIKKNKDINNTLAAYYYYGKAYQGLKNEIKAVDYFKKVDSMSIVKGGITPEFISGYSYLIDYFKKKGDKDNQILYINRFIKIDSLLQKNYKQITKKIQKDYDIPHLMKEKETIISELKSGKKVNYYVIITLFIAVLFALLFGIHQTRLKKTYKERFESLINTVDTNDREETLKQQPTISNNDDIGIADDIVEMILKEIKAFEKNKGYLDASITIQNLAQEFNTNSKYLSMVINAKKEKSFTQYINDLRIDNIVNELKNNKNLRKYTMTAIAEEAGFNTAESFSKSFFKKTGLKPSYFVKELQEL